MQVGTSCLWSLARSSGFLVPGIALIPLAIAAAAALDGDGSLPVGLGIGTGGVLLVIFAGMHMSQAWRDRPSDVVLSPESLCVEGGRFHGLAIPWSRIDRKGTVIKADREKRPTVLTIIATALDVAGLSGLSVDLKDKDTLVEIHRLVIAQTTGQTVVLAEAERPIERESLRALLDSIQGDHWYGSPEKPPAVTPAPPTVLSCARCGAATPPAETEFASCPYCGTAVPVPEAIRQGVRDGRVLTREHRMSERVLGRLIGQPGARTTNALFLAAALPMFLAWPLAIALAARASAQGPLTGASAAKLAIFALALILSPFFLARARLVDRFALRLLTLGFAARAPVSDEAPFTCRRCGAPLAAAQDSVRVPCVYCGSDNLVGIDLGHRVVVETEQADALGVALRRRSQERRLWSGLGAGAIVLLVVASWLLYSVKGGLW